MNRKLMLLVSASLGGVVLAQTPSDPTVPTKKMAEALAPPVNSKNAAPLPVITIKGRILAKNKPPLALLDIGGAQYSVAPGMIVETSGRKLRIASVTALDVKITVEGTPDSITLN